MRVEQAFIHVDVDNLRAIFDLIARDLDRGFIIAREDQLLEPGAAGNIGALADIDEAGGIWVMISFLAQAAMTKGSRPARRVTMGAVTE